MLLIDLIKQVWRCGEETSWLCVSRNCGLRSTPSCHTHTHTLLIQHVSATYILTLSPAASTLLLSLFDLLCCAGLGCVISLATCGAELIDGAVLCWRGCGFFWLFVVSVCEQWAMFFLLCADGGGSSE